MRLPVLVLTLVTLSACAKSPESIQAAYVSPVQYDAWTCSQLGEEASRVNDALTTASSQQRTARRNDTMGVIFLGLPVSSLSGGNVTEQVASLKGHRDVIAKAATRKDCSLPVLVDPMIVTAEN